MSQELFNNKKKFINTVSDELDIMFSSLADKMAKAILQDFVDELDRDGDVIKNTPANLQKIAVIDKIYNALMGKQGLMIVQSIIKNVETISKINVDYFSQFGGKGFNASQQKVRKIIRDRLGIGDKVQLKEGGYMDSLLKDTKVKNDIKKLCYQEVLKGGGFKNFKRGLELFIKGDEDKLGAFKQHYRQYAYDVYVQVDRDESLLMAKEVGLQYFIYEGTLIDSSRRFCQERADNVYSIKEAEAWVNDPWIKRNIEKGYITSYNPITDMGLFGCRHIPRFISKEVAIMMRPELKESGPSSEEKIKKQTDKNEKINSHSDVESASVISKIREKNSSEIQRMEKRGVVVYDEILQQLPEDIVIKMNGTGSFYDAKTKTINIRNDAQINDEYYQKKIILHEGAHAIHFEKGIITDKYVDPTFKTFYQNLKNIIKGKEGDLNSELLDLAIANYKNDSLRQQVEILMDTLGSLTRGEFGAGHSREYYTQGNYSEMEVFAHAVTLLKLENKYSNHNDLIAQLTGEMKKYASNILK